MKTELETTQQLKQGPLRLPVTILHCEFISDADHRRFITNRFIIYRSNCIGTLFCSKDNMNEIIWFCYRHIQWFSVYQYNFCLLYNVRCF